MLQFIFGKPLSGKTSYCLDIVSKLSSNNKEIIYIVPEQFTFETERSILNKIGDRAALNISVLSFSRLYDDICHKTGGTAAKILNDYDKIIFMSRALEHSKDQLKIWNRYTNSLSFSKSIIDTINELKLNSISYSKIKEVAKSIDNVSLKQKLLDLSVIYESFDYLLGEKYIDPADKLTFINKKLEKYKYFNNKTVFIDSFIDFSGQQYDIIKRVLAQSENVYISFTYNPIINNEFDLFSNIRRSVEKIKKYANSYNVKIQNDIYLENCNYNSDALINLEKLISGESIIKPNDLINICSCETIYDEADFCARTIRKLIRTKGLRYKDFVIIARDSKMYSQAVYSACKKNEINCYFDDLFPLSAFPIYSAVQSVFNSINYSTENILKFHKTGLGTLSIDEVSMLENYCYLWNIDGLLWQNDWNMNPKGFTITKPDDDEINQEIKYINELRLKAIEPINIFKENLYNNAKSISNAIIKLFEKCNISEKLLLMSEKLLINNDIFNDDLLKQSYDKFLDIINGIVNCYNEINLTPEKYFEILKISVLSTEIGSVPQTVDQVIFGSADRIRVSKPKIAFILGANQGIFPKICSQNGIFNYNDRKHLIECGLEISDNSIQASVNEDYLVYCNLCRPTDELYISYYNCNNSGDIIEPSVFVKSILSNFPCNLLYEPSDMVSEYNLPETLKDVYSQFCKRFKEHNNKNILNNVLKDTEYKYNVEYINNINLNNKNSSITPENAKKLFGKNINMSASKLDTLNHCKFSYFCKYGIKAEKIQPADFNVMQKGTIVHYVLERFITDNSESINNLDNENIDLLCDEYIDEYLKSISGYATIETQRAKFIVSRLRRSLIEVIYHIVDELKQSKFKPIACELKIGYNSDLPHVEFPFNDSKIVLNGSIDRVDEYKGYIRIIDYKTGSKTFKLPDILFGLNLQMLLYLYALIRKNNKNDKQAAGILYQPSKRDLNGNGLAMNGLLQDDIDIVSAMEKDHNGKYIPKLKYNKDGSMAKSCTSYINHQDFTKIFDYIEKIMEKSGKIIHSGDISIEPVDGIESSACKYCDYASICGIENCEAKKVNDGLSNNEVFDILSEECKNGI